MSNFKMKHLENGTIFNQDGKFIARDTNDKFLTYGETIIHAQMELVSYMREKYKSLPHVVEFKKSICGIDFSVFKRGLS